MEDSVTENEKLQVLITSVEDEDEEEGGAAKKVIINGEDVVEDKPAPAVGLIKQLITNFTPAGEGKEQEMGDKQEMEETRNNDGGDHDLVEEKEKPIGLINQSFAPGEKEKDKEEEIDNKVSEENVEEKKGGGGGVFSRIMSNLVSSPVSSPRAPRDEKQAGKAGDDDLNLDNSKTREKDGNGVIDNIVSKLPTPLPDDAAPASDEASILIYSIIHD